MDNPEHAKLAETYTLIYTFLSGREHAKAAKSVKKAAKESGVVSIKSSSEPSTLNSLENIVFEWTALSTRNLELEALNKQLSEDVKSLKKLQKHKKDSSDSDSSSSNSKSSKSSSSSSSSGSDTLSSSKSTSKPKTHKKEAKLNSKHKKQKTHSETSDSEEELEVAKTVLAPITPLAEIPNPILAHQKEDSSSDSDSDEQETKPTPAVDIVDHKSLKRRRTENGVVTTAVEVQVQSEEKPETVRKGGKEVRRGGVPFQRIKVDRIEFQDSRLMDNTFAARRASEADYGAKASQDLIVTRGAGFRKEKNKKKRGSYRGGEITMESHSIKFE